MREGSSFHSLGPAKSIKRLRDSSLEIEFVTLVRLLLRKLLAKLSGKNPFFSLHVMDTGSTVVCFLLESNTKAQ